MFWGQMKGIRTAEGRNSDSVGEDASGADRGLE